jgi:DNA-binding transcriptional regulator YiaG
MMTKYELVAVSTARKACADGEVRNLRRALGVSVHELADTLRVRAATLSRWETGKMLPTGQRAIRLAKLLPELLDAAS